MNKVTVELDLENMLFDLNENQAFELIKKIDEEQADWNFTKNLILSLIKVLKEDSNGILDKDWLCFKNELDSLIEVN